MACDGVPVPTYAEHIESLKKDCGGRKYPDESKVYTEHIKLLDKIMKRYDPLCPISGDYKDVEGMHDDMLFPGESAMEYMRGGIISIMCAWEAFIVHILEEAFEILHCTCEEEDKCECLEKKVKVESQKKVKVELQKNITKVTTLEKHWQDQSVSSRFPEVNTTFTNLFQTKISLFELIFDMGPIPVHTRFNKNQFCDAEINDKETLCDVSRLWYGIRCVLAHGIADKTFKHGVLADFPNGPKFKDAKELYDKIQPITKKLKALKDDACKALNNDKPISLYSEVAFLDDHEKTRDCFEQAMEKSDKEHILCESYRKKFAYCWKGVTTINKLSSELGKLKKKLKEKEAEPAAEQTDTMTDDEKKDFKTSLEKVLKELGCESCKFTRCQNSECIKNKWPDVLSTKEHVPSQYGILELYRLFEGYKKKGRDAPIKYLTFRNAFFFIRRLSHRTMQALAKHLNDTLHLTAAPIWKTSIKEEERIKEIIEEEMDEYEKYKKRQKDIKKKTTE